MRINTRTRIVLESIFLPFIPGIVNIIIYKDPGFSHLFFLPYGAITLVIAAYYGKLPGFISLLSSVIWISCLLPLFHLLFRHIPLDPVFWKILWENSWIVLPFLIVGIYLFGLIRDAHIGQRSALKNRMKELVKANWLLRKTSAALSMVDRELEEKVSRQQESITILYNQIHKIQGMKLQEALDTLLETVQLFTRATNLSVWEQRNSPSNGLYLAASRGWNPEKDIEKVRSIENSIEGWVYRNNSIFSLRMLLQYDNLKELDMKRNILTFPIVLNKTVWGILNIKEMPFEKYTRYSESIVQMIIQLAAPSLEQAFDYETLLLTGDIDPETHIPAFSQFSSVLEEAAESALVREGNLSIILLELVNLEELLTSYGDTVWETFFPTFSDHLIETTKNKGQLFHYKNKNQLVLIVPNVDFDGASLLCLDILEMINFTKWNIKGDQISLETAIAFSALGGETNNAETMMGKVESIIQVQKA